MDDDLRVLLHSPALTLEPPTALPDVVRRRARRHRLMTRVGGVAATLAVVAGGLVVGPSLAGGLDNLRSNANRAGAPVTDPRAPHATTEVLTLREANHAELLTWFEGSRWCTQTTRVHTQLACFAPVDPARRGFSYVVPVGSAAATIDDQHYITGIAPPGATRIVVHMSDGREFDTDIVSGPRFPVSVWSSVAINLSYGHVAYYAAYDSTGVEIARKPAS